MFKAFSYTEEEEDTNSWRVVMGIKIKRYCSKREKLRI